MEQDQAWFLYKRGVAIYGATVLGLLTFFLALFDGLR